ncbi:MAG: zf-HC2 domain-containing protein [Chloroflexi bacterium]|nr:zf-HC2 domain-containing protein [Chloroflexota bacterium]
MMNQEHVLPLISDYVLDLLPGSERRRVELHAAECAACRQALKSERQLGDLVRRTVQAATEPGYGRLPQLMPAIPSRRPAKASHRQHPQRQLALAGLLLLLLIGTFGLRFGQTRRAWQPPLPTAVVSTATITSTATATLAEMGTSTRVLETAVSATTAPAGQPAFQSQAHPTPAPMPTPLALARPPISTN